MMNLRHVTAATFFLYMFSPGQLSAQNSDPTEIPSPIEKIFVPNVFDDNDNVEVILHGEFPDSCYRVGKTAALVDEDAFLIDVTATSFRYPGLDCAAVKTLFVQHLKIGILKTGTYKLTVNSNSAQTTTFGVKARISESADDYMYAPVSYGELSKDQTTGKQSIEIIGDYPLMLHGCAMIDKIEVLRDSKDIVVVLPIMHIYEGRACDDHELRFKKTIKLDVPFSGEGLLHIRSINGNSYNRFLNL